MRKERRCDICREFECDCLSMVKKLITDEDLGEAMLNRRKLAISEFTHRLEKKKFNHPPGEKSVDFIKKKFLTKVVDFFMKNFLG